MYIFTPNTLIESAKVNANFTELDNRVLVLEQTLVRSVLASTFNSTTSLSYQDTGLKVTLPNAGTWKLHCNLRVSAAGAANAYCVVRLFNETTSTAIANSDRIGLFLGAATTGGQVTTHIDEKVDTTTANNIIRVELRPAVALAHSLYADTNGYSTILAERKS